MTSAACCKFLPNPRDGAARPWGQRGCWTGTGGEGEVLCNFFLPDVDCVLDGDGAKSQNVEHAIRAMLQVE